MKNLEFNEILKKLKKNKFDDFDVIIAIGRGGIVPASLVQNILKRDMEILWLNFRDEKHCPKRKKPKLVKEINFDFKNKKILLVDDVSRTGETLDKAKKILKGNKIKTFVINGEADYSLYNFKECIKFPWG